MRPKYFLIISFIMAIIIFTVKISLKINNTSNFNNPILNTAFEKTINHNNISNKYFELKNVSKQVKIVKILPKRIKRENFDFNNNNIKYFLKGIFDHERLFCVEERKRFFNNNTIGINDIHIAAMFEDNKLTNKIKFIKFTAVNSVGSLVDESNYTFFENTIIKLLTSYWSFDNNPIFYHQKHSLNF